MNHLLKEAFGELSLWGKFWLNLGLVSLIAAAGMSFMVGWKMTVLHALFLAALSFVTAFLPMAAEHMWSKGRKIVALGMALCAVPLFVIEFGQHAAYTAGIRGHDIATTKVQNVKYDGAQDTVAENKALLATFTARLATLESQNTWAASTTAHALRANLDSAQKAIDLETARGGCKAKCLDRMKERDSLNERIAKLEERTDLTTRIEATKNVLARVRDKASTVDHVSSQTEHMNAFLSKAVALFGQGTLKPSEMTEESTKLSANLAMALAGTGLPALALFVAGLYRRREDETPPAPKAAAPLVPVQPVYRAPAPASRAIAAPMPADVAVGRAVWAA